MIDMWVARCKDNRLLLFVGQMPEKVGDEWQIIFSDYYFWIDDDLFQEVQWSDDEPTKVKLVIDK